MTEISDEFESETEMLLAAIMTDSLTETMRDRVEQLLQTDESFRETYLECIEMDALLRFRSRHEENLKMASDVPPDRAKVQLAVAPSAASKLNRMSIVLGIVVALAAGIVAMVFLMPTDSQPKVARVDPSITSSPQDPFEFGGWSIRPGGNAVYQLVGNSEIRLAQGELFADSKSEKAKSKLTVVTDAGEVTSSRARFYVACEPNEREQQKRTGESSGQLSARGIAVPSITRLLVMAGTAVLANSEGEMNANPGSFLTANPEEAPCKMQEEGNFREAFDVYEKLIVSAEHVGKDCRMDIDRAWACLQRLGRLDEWDALIETVVESHQEDWEVLYAVALRYWNAPHHGVVIDNRFHRASQGCRPVNTTERDRVRALQLMTQAMPMLPSGVNSTVGNFYLRLSEMIQGNRQLWNLQTLTNIDRLPEFGEPVYWSHNSAPPVDEDGKPIYYQLPNSWDAAANDGERWRWLLQARVKAAPSTELEERFRFADFLHGQFGVHTSGSMDSPQLVEGKLPEQGRYATHTLSADETIARLATGVRRFELPKQQNFIELYRQIAEVPLGEPSSPIRDLTYRVYHGSWRELPDFASLEPVKNGALPDGMFDLDVAERKEFYGVVFEGKLEVSRAGECAFELQSDDGVRLWINDKLVIDYDGLHGMDRRKGKVELAEGPHRIRLEYFQHDGPEGLILNCQLPGQKRRYLSRQRPSMSPQERAMEKLAYIHENRRQFEESASWWKRCIERFGTGNNKWRRDHYQQIVGNWLRFETAPTFPAGQKARLAMKYRNATSVQFTARRVDMERVIADAKAYLKSDPRRVENKFGILGIGQRIVGQREKIYLAEESIGWTKKLDPPANHWTSVVQIETPLNEAGVYLVEATASDGNTSRVLCWITDTTIVMKRSDNGHLYFVADSMTGEPIEKANVEVFAYWKQHNKETGRDHTLTRNFARFTDKDGLVYTNVDDVDDKKYSRIVIARDQESGRFGFLGDFFREGLSPLVNNPYQQVKAWCATDRPVYRPGQHVHHKSWIRLAQYDLDHVSMYGGKEFTVAVSAPGNKEVFNKKIRTDEFGGLSFDWRLDDDAMLGTYHYTVVADDFTQPSDGKVHKQIVLGSGNFRVEEYKKPEYEVTVDAPSEPVALGDSFSATVRANYYFGAPVTDAKVKYTVKRTSTADTWFPAHRWDWLYGEGHWWWGYDYSWYPGRTRWGLRPIGWFRASPPEIVAENTVPIGRDGTVKIEIDTAITKERFGDTDHRYQITAEVVDDSRRTVTGNGAVVAARKPYRVFVWMNGGYYRAGEQMEACIQARTANGKGVSGTGHVVLYRIVFDDMGKPSESEVGTWTIETDNSGHAKLVIKADRPGQYRLACELADKEGQKCEGAALTRILAGDNDSTDDGFRFDDLELVLDKSDYRPGERARLLINTDEPNSTVALFVRPVDGVYTHPQIIKLDGKSAVQEIDIARQDMPNIHVEAFTISKGRLYQASKQILVPPEKRELMLSVQPSKEEYEPGGKAKVKLQLTDSDGEPFVGSTVVAIYDKSLEAIASSQIPDIRRYFWKWSRRHRKKTRVSNGYRFGQLLERGEVGMNDLGSHWTRNGRGLNDFVFFHQRGRKRRALGLESREALASFGLGRQSVRWDVSLDSGVSPFVEHYKGINYMEGDSVALGESDDSPSVRSRFADTALWVSSVTTDKHGIAEVELDMPENLTTWKIKAWSMGHGTRVGHGEAEVMTSKDVLVRLQTPRFFTESDEVVISANVHNYTGQKRDFNVSVELPGNELALMDAATALQIVSIKPDEDLQVNWRVRAFNEGQTVIRIKATTTDDKSDAMEQSYPVFVHGVLKTDAYSLAIRGDEESKKTDVVVPEKRRDDQTNLEIRYSPSISLSLVDALPYLAANPYKNSEAAMSRFGPLVTLKKILTDMGVDLKSVRDKQINLNPQEIGDAKKRSAQWQQARDTNPIFDETALNKLVERSLRDLTTQQNPDGGLGWYAGHGSNPHTTAYVVHGLRGAQQSGAAIVPRVIDRGLSWLQRHQKRELKKLQNANGKYRPWKATASNTDAFVFMVLVEADRTSPEMTEFLYRDRLQLSYYCQAMVGLALDKLGETQKRDMVVRNLSQFLEQDSENQTAWLRLGRSRWWNWYGDSIETNACFLKLLCRTGKAKGAVAAGLAKYLLNNRKHTTHWNSSRDTAVAIEALAEFALTSGETDPDMVVSVLIDGELRKEVRITKENLYSFDNVVRLSGADVAAGKHEIEIRRTGRGPLYANVYLTNFTMEDSIGKAGLEVKVERRYYKLTERELDINAAGARGNVVDYRVNQWTRTLLESGATLASGDLVEVELILESKNDYEYLQFSDRKAAGFEAMEANSGHRWLGGVSAYMELRDERVDFFIQRLSRGRHSLIYRLRAEVPGAFSALPANCNGVYAPELRANSDEAKLNIE